MGLLDWIFGRRDPAMDWVPKSELKLEVDLSDASLCGVKLGDPIERLSPLGPPENPDASEKTGYAYFSRGLEVGPDPQGRFDYFLCYWGAPDRPRYRPFAGTFSWKGKTIAIDGRMTVDDAVARFGDPYHVDADEEESILRYQLDDAGWELEFARGGGLRAFLLERPGHFSDPETRKNYGITRPWPPLPGQGRPG